MYDTYDLMYHTLAIFFTNLLGSKLKIQSKIIAVVVYDKLIYEIV